MTRFDTFVIIRGHPDTGHEIKKQFFISVPYFPGLSESFKSFNLGVLEDTQTQDMR